MSIVTFNNPQYLWFLLFVPVLIMGHFLALKYTRKKAIKFANFEAIARVTHSHVLSKNYGLLLWRLVVVVFVVLAASGTVLWYVGEVSDFDFVIAIDGSTSMLATDLKPTRFDAAKDAARSLVDTVGTKGNIGIVTFATTSFVEIEPTINTLKITEVLDNMDVKRIGGTNIGDAILTSTNLLLDVGKGSIYEQHAIKSPGKAIVLMTDGQGTVGDVADAIKYAQQNNVIVHTIGVGTEKGGLFVDLNITGIKTTLDRQGLARIAEATNGKFFEATNKKELFSAYSSIASLQSRPTAVNLSVPLLVVAFLLLLIEWLLINTRYTTLP
jgi:Ca-activated chloride channel homolog